MPNSPTSDKKRIQQLELDVRALVQAHGEALQNHKTMAESVAKLTEALMKPRKKVPVRDKQGNITHVLEMPE